MTLKEENEQNIANKEQEPTAKVDAAQTFLRAVRSNNKQKILDFLDSGGDIASCNANGLNALHIASKEGLLDLVVLLLSRGAQVNSATKKGNTALHIASLAGKHQIVSCLIEHGAKVNVQSQNGFTPLYMASQENHVEVVKLLLLNSASQTLATDDGFTPLAVALQQGHEKVVAILLENDSRGRIRLPALHIAAKKDDVKAANLLLTNEADVDHQSASGFTPLHIAAHYGNVNITNLLIERGGDVNFQAKNNITPLHVSTKWGNLAVTEKLVEKGAQLECKTRDGLTPLHCAVRSGHAEIVAFLLKSGGSHNTKTRSGLTALHMASQGDHLESGQLLIKAGSNIDELTLDFLTPLHVAAHCGHVRMAKLLIDHSCEINSRALNGFTPLHIACKRSHIKIVDLLLRSGASVESTTESGLSSLHVAAFMGHINIAKQLMQAGANPNLTTVRCETSLHLATRANQLEMCKLLLLNGAIVDARAKEQQTPLHIASRLGNVKMIQLLLANSANPNTLTKDNYSTLHIAAKEDHVDAARILIEAGAKLELTTRKGFTALHIAAKHGKVHLAKLLLQLGTDPNVQGRNGLTPLHLAVHYGCLPLSQLLLEFQASPFKTSKNGYTPLHIAARKNFTEIAEILLASGANANSESRNGFSPLHLCSQEGHCQMTQLLIGHGANANFKAKNLLSCMHLAAQEDRVAVAEILEANACEIDSKTKAGYTPLHTACHFGKLNMIRYLLRCGSDINAQTHLGSTAMHLAAQQGHYQVINLLLEHQADPNIRNSQNLTAAHVAYKQHYLNIFEILKRVVTVVTRWDEEQDEIVFKMELERPEIMGENPVSDSEDEYGDNDYTIMPASPLFARQSLASSNTGGGGSGGSSGGGMMMQLPPHSSNGHMGGTTTSSSMSGQQKSGSRHTGSGMGAGQHQSDKNSTISGEDSIHEGYTDSNDMLRNGIYKDTMLATKLRNDYSSAVNDWDYMADNVPIARKPITSGFLVSFLVDARGGSMRSSRHPSLRLLVPPGAASAPTRVTCRQLAPDRLQHPPPLSDGEGVACRVLEMGPHPCHFNGPVLLEVPHYASLRARQREIVILRCDNPQEGVWREHTHDTTDRATIANMMSMFHDNSGAVVNEEQQQQELDQQRLVQIVTSEFPVYFALITRLRQEIAMIDAHGGVITSSLLPQVQAVFPEGALQKRIKVGLQAHSIEQELVQKLLGNNRIAVSPIVTIEPRRRKFHKPITVTIPLPSSTDMMTSSQTTSSGVGGSTVASALRLLCSISGGTNPAQWEDITGSTPLSQSRGCVSFTTTVSARFWLIDLSGGGPALPPSISTSDSTGLWSKLYREATLVPYMGKFVVFAKHQDTTAHTNASGVPEGGSRISNPLQQEVLIRCFCITDDKVDKTLECQEGFELKAASPEVEVLDRRDHWLETAGSIIPVTKLGDQLRLYFVAFRENRLPFPARIKDEVVLVDNVANGEGPGGVANGPIIGKIAFMRDARGTLASYGAGGPGPVAQKPLCTLEIDLSWGSGGIDHHQHSHNHHNYGSKVEDRPSQMISEQIDSHGRPLFDDQHIWNDVPNEDDAIAKSELDMHEVAQEIGSDWRRIGRELGLSDEALETIARASDASTGSDEDRALMMLLTWSDSGLAGDRIAGNVLNKALRNAGREDVIKSCMKNFQRVLDNGEQARAKLEIDGGSMGISAISGEMDLVKDSESMMASVEAEDEEHNGDVAPREQEEDDECIAGAPMECEEENKINPTDEDRAQDQEEIDRELEEAPNQEVLSGEDKKSDDADAKINENTNHQEYPPNNEEPSANIDLAALDAFDNQLHELNSAADASRHPDNNSTSIETTDNNSNVPQSDDAPPE